MGNPYSSTPVFVSVAGVLLMLVAAGPTVFVSMAAIVLMGAGVYAGQLLARGQMRAIAAIRNQADREIARFGGLYAQTAPVWIRQIETVRGEGDSEVAQLVRLFGAITEKLDSVMRTHRLAESETGTGEEEVLSALAHNGRQLESLVTALRLLQSSKERIVDEIGNEAARLKDNAAEIRQIAMHIRMVSLNATIEAARAGQAGKPFGVIVAGMRDLAVRTAEASEQFSRHTDRLHGMVATAFQEQAQTDSQIVSIAGAESLVQKVIASSESMMRQLTRAIAAMEDDRRKLRQDISSVLVSLQFQDRVSQILSHVSRNLEEMQHHIECGNGGEADHQEWMDHTASIYSTHEEFDNHGGARLSSVHASSEVTFF